MKLVNSVTHCRTTRATLGEVDVRKLLGVAIAAEAGIDLTRDNVKLSVVVSKREGVGHAGFEIYADVTITEDLRPDAAEAVT